MATGFPVKANYATGDVLTAANMNDLSGTVNYLQYMPPRNPVLNSSFNVWQRGTSISLAASSPAYTADRWYVYVGASQATTVSRQATNDTTNLPNIQYCVRVQRNSGQTGTTAMSLSQPFESVNSIPFAGKTVTLSFYARAGANFSAASGNLTIYLATGTGTDQNQQGAGYTGQSLPISSSATLTTTWQRFTYSATLGATITELQPIFSFTPVGTAGTNDYFELTGVQLELGSTANTYMPNQPTYQGELAACQRYYEEQGGVNTQFFGNGYAYSSTAAAYVITFQPKRTTPSVSVSAASDFVAADGAGSGVTMSSASLAYPCVNTVAFYATVASGLTTGRGSAIYAANTNARVKISAEL